MGIRNDGKALMYINNFDGEKNSIGTTDRCYDVVSGWSGEVKLYRGLTSIPIGEDEPAPRDTERRALYYDFLKYLYIHISSVSTDTVYEGGYNQENETVYANNPVVLHLTRTARITAGGTIPAFEIRSTPPIKYYSSSQWTDSTDIIRFAEVTLPSPLTVSTGDIVTFTVVIK